MARNPKRLYVYKKTQTIRQTLIHTSTRRKVWRLMTPKPFSPCYIEQNAFSHNSLTFENSCMRSFCKKSCTKTFSVSILINEYARENLMQTTLTHRPELTLVKKNKELSRGNIVEKIDCFAQNCNNLILRSFTHCLIRGTFSKYHTFM